MRNGYSSASSRVIIFLLAFWPYLVGQTEKFNWLTSRPILRIHVTRVTCPEASLGQSVFTSDLVRSEWPEPKKMKIETLRVLSNWTYEITNLTEPKVLVSPFSKFNSIGLAVMYHMTLMTGQGLLLLYLKLDDDNCMKIRQNNNVALT